MQDAVGEALARGIEAWWPEVAGAPAGAALLELGHEQEGEGERKEEHDSGERKMRSELMAACTWLLLAVDTDDFRRQCSA